MKKKLLLSLAASMPLFAFAYRDYNESSNASQIFIIVLIMVWGVMNLILFFKIWKMTNDVANIKGKLNETRNDISTVSIDYFVKKELYGKDNAVQYLKNVVAKEYQALGASPYVGVIPEFVGKLKHKLGYALEDSDITLPTLKEYCEKRAKAYGNFAPGTQVSVKGALGVYKIHGVKDAETVYIANNGSLFEYKIEDLVLVDK